MRILQVHNRYRERGGEDEVVATERALLEAAGHVVQTASPSNPTGAADAALSLARAPWNGSAARAVATVATQFGAEMAHVHNTWYRLSPAVLPALQAAGIPVVMTLHNYRLACSNSLLLRDGAPCEDCVGSHPWHAVRHACYRQSRLQSVPAAATIALNRRWGTWARHVDRFIVMSSVQKDRMVASGLPGERIDIRPHSTAEPGPRPRSPSESRKIVYVGRLSPEKGVRCLLDAFAAADTDLELTILGGGSESADLSRHAAPLARVRLLGRVDHDLVQRHLLEARALVFPSLWPETFGLSVIEAMAAGTPVVASALGAPATLVGEDSGLLFRAGDPAALAAALEQLAAADRVDAMGAAARERWERRFSPASALRGLEQTYRRARERALVPSRHPGAAP